MSDERCAACLTDQYVAWRGMDYLCDQCLACWNGRPHTNGVTIIRRLIDCRKELRAAAMVFGDAFLDFDAVIHDKPRNEFAAREAVKDAGDRARRVADE